MNAIAGSLPISVPSPRLSGAPATAPETQQPADAVALSGAAGTGAAAPTGANPWAEIERVGLLAGAKAVSGPIGQALSSSARAGLLEALQRLESQGVTFERQRGLRIPFAMKKYVPLTPQEMLDALVEQPATPKKKLNINGHGMEHVRVTSLGVLRAADGVHGLGERALPPAQQGALRALKGLDAAGVKFQGYDQHGYRHMSLSAVEALDSLAAGQRLFPITSKGQYYERVEIRSLEVAVDFDFFEGSGADNGVKDVALASALKSLAAKDYKLKVGDAYYEQSAFSAYQTLSASPKQMVRITAKGGIGTLASVQDLANLPALEKRIQDAEGLYRKFALPALNAAGLDERYGQSFMDVVDRAGDRFPVDLRAAVVSEVVRAHVERGGRDAWENGVASALRLLKRDGDAFEIASVASRYAHIYRNRGHAEAEEMLAALDGGLRKLVADESESGRLRELFARLLDATGAVSVSMEALDLVRIPVGGETEEQRLALFLDIARNESTETVYDAADHYRSVLVNRLPSESLLDAGTRFVHILHALSVGRQQDKAAEVFAVIQSGLKGGRYGASTPDDVVQRFTEALVVRGSAEKALDSLRASGGGVSAGPGTVEQDEEFVVIGGIKVPRSKT